MSYLSAQPALTRPTFIWPHRRAASPMLALLIISAAALLYLLPITTFDLSTDEAHSYMMATHTASIFAALQNDTNPPLYFLLLKSWTALFGSSLLALRSLSTIFALLLIPLIARLAKLCGASQRTALYAMLLTAFNPLQLFYANDARNYSLSLLLLVLGLITFLRAIQSPKILPWLLYALIIALSAYTHFLLIPITLAYWLAAPFLRLRPKQYLRLALAHSLAALLAIPLLLLLLTQLHSNAGTAWIATYWNSIPHALAIPMSLELLPFGNQMPPYITEFSPSPLLRLANLLLILLPAAALFWPRKKSSTKTQIKSPGLTCPGDNGLNFAAQLSNSTALTTQPELASTRPLLLLFTLWPLTFLLLYSLFVSPIYLHARYDLFAQPAYLLLLAAGFSRLHSILTKKLPLLALILPLAICLLLSAGIANRLLFPADPTANRHRARAEYLATHLQANDAILCTGLEAAPTQYELDQLHIQIPLYSFPIESLSHLGWFLPDSAITARTDWQKEAQKILATAAPHGTIYICLDRNYWDPTPKGYIALPRQHLSELLLQTAASMGFHRAAQSPTDQTQENNLRLPSFTRQ